jgi:hypothetical protein
MKAAVSPLNLIYGCGVVFYLAEEINFAVHKSPGFIAGAIATTTKTNIFLQKIVVRGRRFANCLLCRLLCRPTASFLINKIKMGLCRIVLIKLRPSFSCS